LIIGCPLPCVEEVVTLIVYEGEGRKVDDVDLPDGLPLEALVRKF
jgi:hypothetical protein